MKKLYTILLLLLISLTLQSQTTYYIDPGGDDGTGDGSVETPWLTLDYACTQVTTPTDTIYVNPGTYIETAQSGLAVGVSIKGAGETSIITTAAALSPIIYLSSGSEGTDGDQSISYIKVDGDLTAISLIFVSGRKNVEIHHCTFIDAFEYGITFRGKVNTGDAAPTTYATGNKFYDNDVTNCARYNVQGRGNLEFSGQDGLLIYNNTIIQTDRGTTYHGYGLKAVINEGYNKGIKIYNNTITVPPYENVGFEFAIELWTQRGGFEIYDNVISGGIDFGGYDTNDEGGYGYAAKIYNNTIGRDALVANQGRGLVFELGMHGGIYVYKNHFKNISNPLEFGITENDLVPGQEDIYIYYNLFTEIRKSGAGYTGYVTEFTSVGGYTATFNNFQFLNNVIYNSSSGSLAAGFWCGNTDGQTFTNTVIRNNIFVNAYSCVKFESCTVTNINVDNNCFYNCDNTTVYTDCTVTGDTYNDNITDNPDFVGGEPYDFYLQSTSPAINAGINVDLLTDYDDVAVSDPPEIGAYEYGSPEPPELPIITTTTPDYVYTRKGTGGGNVTDDGGGTVSARGICWSTSANPTTSDSKIICGSGIGAFSNYLRGLSASTTYHVRAYATNETGTSYGDDMTFTTPDVTGVKINGKYYIHNDKIVIIK